MAYLLLILACCTMFALYRYERRKRRELQRVLQIYRDQRRRSLY